MNSQINLRIQKVNETSISNRVLLIIQILLLFKYSFSLVLRFNLQFIRESYEELRQMKKNSYKPMEYHAAEELEIDIDDYYKPGSPLDMPLRPKWSYEMSKQQLEANETKYFDVKFSNLIKSQHNEKSCANYVLLNFRNIWTKFSKIFPTMS